MIAYTVDTMMSGWRDGTNIIEAEWEVRDDSLPGVKTIGIIRATFDADDIYCTDPFVASYFLPNSNDVVRQTFNNRRDAVEWIKARYEEDKEYADAITV